MKKWVNDIRFVDYEKENRLAKEMEKSFWQDLNSSVANNEDVEFIASNHYNRYEKSQQVQSLFI